jgi:hypothetical protein
MRNTTLISALELLNNSDIAHRLFDVNKVMQLDNMDASWEHSFSDEVSVMWDREEKFLLSIMDDEEIKLPIEYSSDFGVWFIPYYTVTMEDQFTTSLQEMAVDAMAYKLCSDTVDFDDDERWVIECGDEGWMNFVEELGCYTIGQYGNLYPFELLNALEGLPNVKGKLIRGDLENSIVKVGDC